MNLPNILLVEDSDAIVRSLSEYLIEEGFRVASVSGQMAAEKHIVKDTYDLILIDISIKDGNGYGVCAKAKERGLPVIFLTASGDENSVVAGLDMGADDYVAKPFRPRELVSRIRNILRRYNDTSAIVMLEDVKVNTDKGIVMRGNTEISLSALEYRLLLFFINNRGLLLTRTKLLDEIWDVAGDFVNDNTLTVYIKRIREKIEIDPKKPTIIKTVRGLGYRVD